MAHNKHYREILHDLEDAERDLARIVERIKRIPACSLTTEQYAEGVQRADALAATVDAGRNVLEFWRVLSEGQSDPSVADERKA